MYVEVEGSTQIYPPIQKEEHYSVVSEPGGQYLFHFTPPPADKDRKAAEQLAIELDNWMKKYFFVMGWESAHQYISLIKCILQSIKGYLD